jgi:hypothetical protein
MKWLIALGAIVVGAVLGTVLSAAVRRMLLGPKRPEKLKTLAPAAGSIVFSAVFAFGLVAGLSVIDKTAVDRLPASVMKAVPKFLVALVLILVGNAVASIAGNIASSAALRATGKAQDRLGGLVKSVVLGVFVLLSIGQIGVNTRIVDMAVAGLIGCLALSVALLTGLGGRQVASEIASGRYVRRIVKPGDTISGDGFSGVVRSVWGATTEIEVLSANDLGTYTVHVPNTQLLKGNLRIDRA